MTQTFSPDVVFARTGTYQRGSSDKFWQVAIEQHSNGNYDVIRRWGRNGTSGQQMTETFSSQNAARTHAENLWSAKHTSGYEELLNLRIDARPRAGRSIPTAQTPTPRSVLKPITTLPESIVVHKEGAAISFDPHITPVTDGGAAVIHRLTVLARAIGGTFSVRVYLTPEEQPLQLATAYKSVPLPDSLLRYVPKTLAVLHQSPPRRKTAKPPRTTCSQCGATNVKLGRPLTPQRGVCISCDLLG